jgi:DNA-binding beta-propeller fold protein YncE
MTANKAIFVRFAMLALLSVGFASAGFAATKPLSSPNGLAVDPKGNLYVANYSGNDILVYNPSYKQLTKNTITDGVNGPVGVAFDSYSDLWACNYTSSTLSKYLPAAVVSVGGFNSEVQPLAIAIDGANNIWLNGNNQNLGFFDQGGRTFKLVTPPTGVVNGLAAHLGWVAIGGAQQETAIIGATGLLILDEPFGSFQPGDGYAIAADANDNFYIANSDGTVNVYNPEKASLKSFATLSFIPSGIAVDSVRGRVYFSNTGGDQILVYSTAGTLLHTIE